MPRPKPTCNPRELKALLAPALGLSLEDFTGIALCVITEDEDHEPGERGAPVVDVISDAPTWRQTGLTLSYALQSVLTPG
jgi:hypothetical protein